jgi:uncharacterized protein (DUF2062 family)
VLRRLWARLKTLWKLAREERATPKEIFWAVFLGVFMGCTPAVGIHGWLAVGAATVCRKNRLFAWLGSRISNMVFLPFITIAEIEVAHLARTGQTVTLTRPTIMQQAPGLLLDWCVGTLPVGLALGALIGAMSYAFARRRDRRGARSPAVLPRETKKPAGPPTPSSGWPA